MFDNHFMPFLIPDIADIHEMLTIRINPIIWPMNVGFPDPSTSHSDPDILKRPEAN